MGNNLYQYSAKCFGSQLKRLRYYRGYKTQSVICKKMKISRQVWSLWEKGDRTPNLVQLTEAAALLQVDINYFFIENADPRKYDLTLSYTAVQSNNNEQPASDEINNLMPFTETIVSRELFKIFDNCCAKKGIYAITLTRESGASRAMLEFTREHKDKVSVITPGNIDTNTIESLATCELIIFDDADRIHGDILASFISAFYGKLKGSLIFCGRNIEEYLDANNLTMHLNSIYYSDAITTNDFNKIIQAALPGATNPMINYLRIETGICLSKLYQLAKLIDKKQQEGKFFTLTIESLFDLTNE